MTVAPRSLCARNDPRPDDFREFACQACGQFRLALFDALRPRLVASAGTGGEPAANILELSLASDSAQPRGRFLERERDPQPGGEVDDDTVALRTPDPVLLVRDDPPDSVCCAYHHVADGGVQR
jgi:hypothetical protein